ncbi:protein of unknown function [Candidatus Hydrogenisulfobacillus filiaventi]|uniref:EAL domain-containing protein n=1 Tax=Candidatus Hydrogenisulfobacillus filiaventi TaxID=2707344 RepID=A0A6F8ZCS4_9FIRM|nr:protein of unknown function [Candidatus Hydrogenisulfobacillus filiaventi]
MAGASGTALWDDWLPQADLGVVFQPIVDLSTQTVVGYEALSRPRGPGGRPLDVETLFRAAAEQGRLEWLDRLAFANVVTAAAARFRSDALLFINILPANLEDRTWIWGQLERLAPYVPLRHVVLEIAERDTERNPHQWQRLLAPFRNLGVRIGIDDLGRGYAGLARTVTVAPEWLKLDMELIRNVDQEPAKAAMAAGILEFARRLGQHSAVIAEGVERLAEARTLAELGIRYAQGFLWARPAPEPAPAVATQPVLINRPVASQALGPVLLDRLAGWRYGAPQVESLAEETAGLADLLLQPDHVAVYELSEGGARCLARRGLAVPPLAEGAQERPCLARPLRTGRPFAAQDLAVEGGGYGYTQGLRALLVMPIALWTVTRGLLVAGWRQPHSIGPDHVEVAEGITALAALAFQAAQPRFFGSGAAGLLARLLPGPEAEPADAPRQAHLLAQLAAVLTGSRWAWYGHWTPEGLSGATVNGERFFCPRAELESGGRHAASPWARALAEGSPRVLTQVLDQLPPGSETSIPPLESGSRAALVVPVGEERPRGLLALFHPEAEVYSPRLGRDLAQVLARLTALHPARPAPQPRPRTAFETWARRLQEQSRAAAVLIWRLGARGLLEPAGAAGEPAAAVAAVARREQDAGGHCPAHSALRAPRAVRYDRLDQVPADRPELAALAGLGARSAWLRALRARSGDPLGVLAVLWSQPGPHSPALYHDLEAAADTLAAAWPADVG